MTSRAYMDPRMTKITLDLLQLGRKFTADRWFPTSSMDNQRNQNVKECPDCNGTGRVFLFTSEEDCSTCCKPINGETE